MLLSFLNSLYKKPIDYQLFWLYILGHIKDGQISIVSIKSIKEKFPYAKTKFYRILNYGLPYFCNNENGVFFLFENGQIIIEVKRGKPKLKSIKKASPKSDEKIIESIIEIINYLNIKTNKRFSAKSQQTIRLINARLKEGYLINDFKSVIDIKTQNWMGTSFETYLRPVTLFGTKMEAYLNEPKITTNSQQNDRFTKTQRAVDDLKQSNWFTEE